MKEYNTCHLVLFMLVPVLAGIPVGYAPSYTNNASAILRAKYHYDEKSINESIIGSSVVLGIAFGAAIGGKLVQKGRRLTLFIACAIGTVGIAINLI
jgi:predicted MFS family arabinose efflux permease